MKRTPLEDREIPRYTRSEEAVHVASHVVGAFLGVVALVWCLLLADGPLEIFASLVYSLSMILLYTASSIYHGLPDSMAKRAFQVIDHCTIYIYIAGTYTVVMLVAVRHENAAVAWTVFALEWGVTALAVALTAIDLERYRHFSMTCYIVLGWLGAVAAVPGYRALGIGGSVLIVAGGVSYTAGSVLYGIGRKTPFAHSAFHLFTLLGSVLHLACVVFYVL